MAKKKQQQEVNNPIEGVEQSFSRAEQFIENNMKQLGIGLGIVIALGLGYWSYGEYVTKPMEIEASEALYPAEQAFRADSLQKALNGFNGNLGFPEVAEEYSGTKAGNLAHYYAGISYMNTGDYESAIEHLDQFSSNDGTMNVLAVGLIGDAFHELNQPEEALEYYSKAASLKGTDLSTPSVMFKAAQTAEMLEDWSEALKFYQKLKMDYPNAQQSKDIDKYIMYCETQIDNA